jgi:hypothetical protein
MKVPRAMRKLPIAVSFFLLAVASAPAQGSKSSDKPAAKATDAAGVQDSIAWFGTWQQGLAEAKRTGRPILLMSATPQCHGVPGVW